MEIEIPKSELVERNKIIIDDSNPNVMSDKDFIALKEVIKKYGFLIPIVTNRDLKIADGFHRWKAARDLGIDEVPVIRLDVDEVDRRILRQVLNKLRGEHDPTLQAAELQRIIEEGGSDKLADLLPNIAKELSTVLEGQNEVVEDDFDITKEVETDIVLGDLFQLGEHRLLCGDATKKEDVERLMGGERADMVFTDPPYSVNYEKKQKEVFKDDSYNKIANDELSVEDISKDVWRPVFKNMYDVADDSCCFYMTMPQGGDQMMMMMMMNENWQVKHELIWVKESPVFSMNRLDYDYKHEPIMYGWKKKHNFYGNGVFKTSIWEIKRDSDGSHPTMKPIALIANALKNSTQEGMLVIDFFGGSGSTLIACEQLSRKCRMMEIDPQYVEVICQRWEKLTGKKRVKI